MRDVNDIKKDTGAPPGIQKDRGAVTGHESGHVSGHISRHVKAHVQALFCRSRSEQGDEQPGGGEPGGQPQTADEGRRRGVAAVRDEGRGEHRDAEYDRQLADGGRGPGGLSLLVRAGGAQAGVGDRGPEQR